MVDVTNEEMYLTHGGISISGSLVNSLTSGIKVILDIGRSAGTAARRLLFNSVCPV